MGPWDNGPQVASVKFGAPWLGVCLLGSPWVGVLEHQEWSWSSDSGLDSPVMPALLLEGPGDTEAREAGLQGRHQRS